MYVYVLYVMVYVCVLYVRVVSVIPSPAEDLCYSSVCCIAVARHSLRNWSLFAGSYAQLSG